jgi:hypothetical protein
MSRKIENVVYRFIGQPNAILFLRISREGVFQQPRLISTTSLAQGATLTEANAQLRYSCRL